jgi:hypothetical protein
MKTARTRLGTAVAVAALLALTACSNDTNPPQAQPTPSESASTDPTGTPTDTPTSAVSPAPGTPTVGYDPKTGKINYCKDQKPFTGEAADKFGAKKVMRAYCDLVTLQMEQSFNGDMIRKDGGFRQIEFSAPREYMTQDLKKEWDKDLTAALKGDLDARSGVWAFMLYDAEVGNGYEWFPVEAQEPMVMNQQFSAAQAWVDTSADRTRLALRFTASADLHVTKKGKPYLYPFSKDLTFALIENGSSQEKAWLIDSYRYELDMGKPYKRLSRTADDASESSKS